jgi:hypothetical protein
VQNQPVDKKAIQDLLRVTPGDPESTVRANLVQALRQILTGIEAKEFRQEYALYFVATAMGFLAAGSYQEAARAAGQAMSGVALPAAEQRATPTDLLRGLDALAG